jgi:hypothetical protein
VAGKNRLTRRIPYVFIEPMFKRRTARAKAISRTAGEEPLRVAGLTRDLLLLAALLALLLRMGAGAG